MSKLQHTPGPWKTKGDGVIYVDVKNSNHKYNSALKLGSGWHEDMWCDEDADDEVLANARLIAAAPEMLDALIMVKKYGHSGYVEGSKSDIEFWFKIDRTIEKATGMLKAREE